MMYLFTFLFMFFLAVVFLWRQAARSVLSPGRVFAEVVVQMFVSHAGHGCSGCVRKGVKSRISRCSSGLALLLLRAGVRHNAKLERRVHVRRCAHLLGTQTLQAGG